ncbi:hypothetical protein VPH35_083616 [Triticum aestivum]
MNYSRRPNQICPKLNPIPQVLLPDQRRRRRPPPSTSSTNQCAPHRRTRLTTPTRHRLPSAPPPGRVNCGGASRSKSTSPPSPAPDPVAKIATTIPARSSPWPSKVTSTGELPTTAPSIPTAREVLRSITLDNTLLRSVMLESPPLSHVQYSFAAQRRQ